MSKKLFALLLLTAVGSSVYAMDPVTEEVEVVEVDAVVDEESPLGTSASSSASSSSSTATATATAASTGSSWKSKLKGLGNPFSGFGARVASARKTINSGAKNAYTPTKHEWVNWPVRVVGGVAIAVVAFKAAGKAFKAVKTRRANKKADKELAIT